MLFSLLYFSPSTLLAQAPPHLPHPPDLDPRQAEEALDRGQPHAVLAALRRMAAEPPAREPRVEGESRMLWHLRLRAEVEAGYGQQVVDILGALPEEDRDATEDFWLAQAFLTLGRLEEAAALFRPLAANRDFLWRWESALGLGRVLAAQEKWKPALAALAPIPPEAPVYLAAALEKATVLLAAGDPAEAERELLALTEVSPAFQARQNVLLARARLELHRPAEALLILSGRVVPESGGAIAQDHALLQAESYFQLGQTAEAVNELERYLRQATGRSPREQAFASLLRLLSTQASPSLAELRRLAGDTSEPWRAAEATRILARAEARAGRLPAARELLQAAAARSDHPYQKEIRFDLARLEIENGQPAAALHLLREESGPLAAFWRGVAHLVNPAAQELTLATASFAEVLEAEECSPSLQRAAAFNGALAALLHQADPEPFLQHFRVLSPDPKAEAELRLSAALEAARRADPQAGRHLRELVPALGYAAAFPLAEWLLVTGEPATAQQVLTSLESPAEGGTPSARPLMPEEQEARAYLEIFLTDRDLRSSQAAATLARNFLQTYPASSRRPQVRMKLGEIAYRTGDFYGAYEAFTQVATEAASPTLAAQAWFLAGRSATKLMTGQALDQAMLAFEEAAQGGGETAARARFEQALIFNARNQPAEALVLLDRVARDATEPDLRAAALIETGDTYLDRLAAEPSSVDQALATWSKLSADPEIAASWRHQALTKIGLAQEKAGRPTEALASFYAVLQEGAPSADWFWFERAGFEAGRLLTERNALAEAITVYQQLASAGGPRSQEAATRANRLRLENFLWEE